MIAIGAWMQATLCVDTEMMTALVSAVTQKEAQIK
jgi:hypothetical protein